MPARHGLPYNFEGHSVNAKVCVFRGIGYGVFVARMATATAVLASDNALRLLEVALIRPNVGQMFITYLMYPCMDCTLRTWCFPMRRSLVQQEYRHIVWSVLWVSGIFIRTN